MANYFTERQTLTIIVFIKLLRSVREKLTREGKKD